jgi:hypothetical protein
MKGRFGKLISFGMTLLVLSLFIGGCGKGTGDTGAVSVSLTDAPGLDFDHAYITVKEIWFHTSDVAGTGEAGWQKHALGSPVTIDLAQLSNGASHAVWSGLSLPVGNYRQIRIFLASTEEARTQSAINAGLAYNNEVQIGTSPPIPLRIPTPGEGIRLVDVFPVAKEGHLRLAIDFDAGHDIVKVLRAGVIEFILKPRLAAFDFDRAGAITGTLTTPVGITSFANYTGKNFVIKAEQPNLAGTYRVVRRATTIRPDGTFVLYPLPVFGNATTARYDVLIRGRNVETCIVKQVPVHKGTVPATATDLGTVSMTTGLEYLSNVKVTPTGAWMHYYQTLSDDPVPYEVRFRHINPLSTTGSFFEPLQLSTGPIHVGNYNGGGAISFSLATPVEGARHFNAVADALLYNRSPFNNISSATPMSFGPLLPTAPATASNIDGTITMPGGMMGQMSNGIMFATFGGMIVNTVDVTNRMATGGSFTMPNLPGGAPYSIYGLYTLGWGTNALSAGAVPFIDMRSGSVTGVTMPMIRILP